MAVITLNAVSKSYGAFTALKDASFSIGESDKVALVGPNGCGKTTLLRLITGEESADSGTISVIPRLRVAYVKQDSELTGKTPLLQEVSAASTAVKDLEIRLHQLEADISSSEGEALDPLLAQYSEVQHEYERLGGYAFEAEVKATLTGLGLGAEHWEKPVGVLSGGQKTRAGLAKLLLQKPDILLLDEPTNHLDIDACEWLEDFLKGFGGAVLVVSHDRYFLDKVATKVIDLHGRSTKTYSGNYTAFVKQKEEFLRRSELEYDRQQEEIRKVEEFILRYKAGVKSKQARGRQKQLDKLERVDKVEKQSKVKLDLSAKATSGQVVLDAKGLAKSFGDKRLFSSFDLTVYRGDHIGLIGPNGAGKTTLLRILVNEISADTGRIEEGFNVDAGYFAQDQSDLDLENSVIEELLDANESLLPADARNILARFLFSGDDVFKLVESLSGGERNRLNLCKLMVRRPNLLIMDEPTNHLDIDSREALADALSAYDGTIILTTHDRYILNRLSNRIVHVGNGKAVVIEGDYEEYLRKSRHLTPAVPIKKKAAESSTRQRPARRKLPSPEKVEKRIEDAEGRKDIVEKALQDPEIYKDHERYNNLITEHQQLTGEIDELYELLEEALEVSSR